MESNLETADLNDDELEEIMVAYFTLAENIEKATPPYEKYKKNLITYPEFCEQVKKNVKMIHPEKVSEPSKSQTKVRESDKSI